MVKSLHTLCVGIVALSFSLRPVFAQVDMMTSIDHHNAVHATAQCSAAGDARDWLMQKIYCTQAAEYWGTLAQNDALSNRARRASLDSKAAALVGAALGNFGLHRRDDAAALLRAAIAAYNEEATISSVHDRARAIKSRDDVRRLLRSMPSP